MDSTPKKSNTDAHKAAIQCPHLLTVAPLRLAQTKILSLLFPEPDCITPINIGQNSHGSTKQTDTPLKEILKYQITSPEMIVSDISMLSHQDFNFTLLSTMADIVLIVIDAAFGLEKKDLWIKNLSCLGAIPNIIVAVDNMASTSYSQNRFEELRDEFNDYSLNFDCQNIHILPVDFAIKDNIHALSDHMPWYDGLTLRPLIERLTKIQGNEPSAESALESLDQFAVYLSWLSEDPMLPGRQYLLDNGTMQTKAKISTLKYRFNMETLEHQAAKRLFMGNVGYGNLSLDTNIKFQPFSVQRKNGHFLLRDMQSNNVLAFGIIRYGLRRATNIRWQAVDLDKTARAITKNQKPCVLWFTGLSGSGKSTIASLVEKKLHASGKHTYLLDGDNVRHGLCQDLGFTDADRVENLRRISETAKLFVDAGLIVLVSFISPFLSERKTARNKFETGEFIEIFVDTPLAICEERDIKGLYKKARSGQLKNFTGIDSPYEPPINAEITLDGATASTEEMVDMVLAALAKNLG